MMQIMFAVDNRGMMTGDAGLQCPAEPRGVLLAGGVSDCLPLVSYSRSKILSHYFR